MSGDVSIYIRADGGGFAVSVSPPQPGYEEAVRFASHREARGYGGGLRLCHRWKLCDETQGGGS